MTVFPRSLLELTLSTLSKTGTVVGLDLFDLEFWETLRPVCTSVYSRPFTLRSGLIFYQSFPSWSLPWSGQVVHLRPSRGVLISRSSRALSPTLSTVLRPYLVVYQSGPPSFRRPSLRGHGPDSWSYGSGPFCLSLIRLRVGDPGVFRSLTTRIVLVLGAFTRSPSPSLNIVFGSSFVTDRNPVLSLTSVWF